MALSTGRTWEQYLEDNGLVTEITDKDYFVFLRLLGDTANPNTGSNQVIPANIFNLYKKVTVTAAQIRASGVTPVSIIATEVGYAFSVSSLVVARAGGSIDFDLDDALVFGNLLGDVQFLISHDEFNPSGTAKFYDCIKQGQNNIHTAAYVMRILSGNNASVGDADIDVHVRYSRFPIKL